MVIYARMTFTQTFSYTCCQDMPLTNERPATKCVRSRCLAIQQAAHVRKLTWLRNIPIKYAGFLINPVLRVDGRKNAFFFDGGLTMTQSEDANDCKGY